MSDPRLLEELSLQVDPVWSWVFVAAVAVLGIAGPWMMTTLVEYLQRTLLAIPGAVG